MKIIRIKILSYRSPQRYAVWRTIQSAFQTLQQKYPDVELEVEEVREVTEILKITPVLILPSLVIKDQLACTGRFPKKGEVLGWLEAAIK